MGKRSISKVDIGGTVRDTADGATFKAMPNGKLFPEFNAVKGFWGSSKGFETFRSILDYFSTDEVTHTLEITEKAWCEKEPALTCASKVLVKTQTQHYSGIRDCNISTVVRLGLGTRGIVSELQMQDMTNEEAATIAKTEGLFLIKGENQSGFWQVKIDQKSARGRPYVIEDHFRQHRLASAESKSFASAAACALSIARALGPDLSRTYALDFPEDDDDDVLRSLRAPCMEKRLKGKVGHRVCARCGQSIDEHYAKATGWCTTCSHEYYTLKCSTFRHQIIRHRSHMIQRTSERNGDKPHNGRKRERSRNHGQIEWTTAQQVRLWFADVLEAQGFCCHYSGLRLHPTTFSVERLDEAKGYSCKNCVIVDAHFQGSSRQWSVEKVKAVPLLRKTSSQYDEEEFAQSVAYLNAKKRGTPPELFAIARKHWHSCKFRTDHRKKRRENMEMTLTVGDILYQWDRQKGRCAYLDVPLTFAGDWTMSVERVNNTAGYTPNNIVLVALEVNLSCKWSRDFADSVWPPNR